MLSMLVIFEVVAQNCPKDIPVELYIFLDHQFLDAPPPLMENPSSHELWGQRGVSI